jgi:hypothetical protein
VPAWTKADAGDWAMAAAISAPHGGAVLGVFGAIEIGAPLAVAQRPVGRVAGGLRQLERRRQRQRPGAVEIVPGMAAPGRLPQAQPVIEVERQGQRGIGDDEHRCRPLPAQHRRAQDQQRGHQGEHVGFGQVGQGEGASGQERQAGAVWTPRPLQAGPQPDQQ